MPGPEQGVPSSQRSGGWGLFCFVYKIYIYTHISLLPKLRFATVGHGCLCKHALAPSLPCQQHLPLCGCLLHPHLHRGLTGSVALMIKTQIPHWGLLVLGATPGLLTAQGNIQTTREMPTKTMPASASLHTAQTLPK